MGTKAARFRPGWASLLALGLLALILALGIRAGPPAPSAAAPGEADYAPGIILVKFREGGPTSETLQLLRVLIPLGGRTLPALEVLKLQVPLGSEQNAVAALRRQPDVAFAELDYRVSLLISPNDPSYGSQWALPKINAPAAWDITTGSSSVLIAIVDSGVQANHPDLTGRVVGCQGGVNCDFVNDDNDPSDDNGHGTHVAGIAAAAGNNDVGVAGLAWGARILPAKVLSVAGSGSMSNVASGVTYAADQGAKIVTLSLGSSASSQTLALAVSYAQGRGALVIAAAGNDRLSGCPITTYPAALPGVLAVAATDPNDTIASFSTCGLWVDLAAPGVSILSTLSSSNYGSRSGTSMAAPHVAGLAALMWSLKPTLTATQVQELLKATAVDLGASGKDNDFGYGRIDAGKAVQVARDLAPRQFLPLLPNSLP